MRLPRSGRSGDGADKQGELTVKVISQHPMVAIWTSMRTLYTHGIPFIILKLAFVIGGQILAASVSGGVVLVHILE